MEEEEEEEEEWDWKRGHHPPGTVVELHSTEGRSHMVLEIIAALICNLYLKGVWMMKMIIESLVNPVGCGSCDQ